MPFYSSEECLVVVISWYKIFPVDVDTLDFVLLIFVVLFRQVAGSHLFGWMASLFVRMPQMKAHLFLRN